MSPRTFPRAAPRASESTDQLVLLRHIPWKQYEALLRAIGDDAGVRTTYLEGKLEIMCPGRQHEHVSTLLGRLVEAFAEVRGLSLNGFGSETFKREAKQAGLEPDKCDCVGPEKPILDLAIEVVITSSAVDKLEVYERLGFREVWFWENDKLALHALGPDAAYHRRRASRVLRGFPVARVERIVRETDRSRQTEAVREFRLSLE